jgi:formylglycine-generating enzyme required for sulfatase activity
MAGNVCEWTKTLYKSYPYSEKDGRNALETEGSRTIRGGSWDNNERLARCAFRGRDVPGLFVNHVGFQVVLSLGDSDS